LVHIGLILLTLTTVPFTDTNFPKQQKFVTGLNIYIPRRGRDRMVVGFITTYAISLNPA
jgi:hypothetical protein